MVRRQGEVDYIIEMHNKKKLKTFHMNMLRQFHSANCMDTVVDEEDIPFWPGKLQVSERPAIGEHLSREDKEALFSVWGLFYRC